MRRRYKHLVGAGGAATGEPIGATPGPSNVVPPAVADTPQQPEALEQANPVEKAAHSAIAARIQEMERAEAISAQPRQEPPQAGTIPQQTVEQVIANSNLPDRAKTWLRQHPEYVGDPAKAADIQNQHWVAKHLSGGREFTDAYFDRMEVLLGMRSEAPTPAPQPAPRLQAPIGPSVNVSAPPTRDSPSWSTGKATPSAHDKLASSFLTALQEKWETQGPQLLDRMADSDPVRVCELVAKLVPIKPPAPVINGKQPDTTEEIARHALTEIGMDPDAIEQADVQLAKTAYQTFLKALEDIRDLNVYSLPGGKPSDPE